MDLFSTITALLAASTESFFCAFVFSLGLFSARYNPVCQTGSTTAFLPRTPPLPDTHSPIIHTLFQPQTAWSAQCTASTTTNSTHFSHASNRSCTVALARVPRHSTWSFPLPNHLARGIERGTTNYRFCLRLPVVPAPAATFVFVSTCQAAAARAGQSNPARFARARERGCGSKMATQERDGDFGEWKLLPFLCYTRAKPFVRLPCPDPRNADAETEDFNHFPGLIHAVSGAGTCGLLAWVFDIAVSKTSWNWRATGSWENSARDNFVLESGSFGGDPARSTGSQNPGTDLD